MNAIDFITDPRERESQWWIDPDTNECVTRCPICNAEARHTEQELINFHFQHNPWCPVPLGLNQFEEE